MGASTWNNRVETYLGELERIAETIDLILDETRVQTVAVQDSNVAESTGPLEAALVELEDKIAEREALLRADDAPASGLTLTSKLLGTRHLEDARLAERCKKVAGSIVTAHGRAVSLFVCQFHLADLTSDILRVLSGTTAPETYGTGNHDQKPTTGRGGIFDKAA